MPHLRNLARKFLVQDFLPHHGVVDLILFLICYGSLNIMLPVCKLTIALLFPYRSAQTMGLCSKCYNGKDKCTMLVTLAFYQWLDNKNSIVCVRIAFWF